MQRNSDTRHIHFERSSVYRIFQNFSSAFKAHVYLIIAFIGTIQYLLLTVSSLPVPIDYFFFAVTPEIYEIWTRHWIRVYVNRKSTRDWLSSLGNFLSNISIFNLYIFAIFFQNTYNILYIVLGFSYLLVYIVMFHVFIYPRYHPEIRILLRRLKREN